MPEVKNLPTTAVGTNDDYIIKDTAAGTATEKITRTNFEAIDNEFVGFETGLAGIMNGTQVTSTPLTKKTAVSGVLNPVNPGYLLPPAVQNRVLYFKNITPAACNIFPQVGEYIGVLAVDTPYNLGAGVGIAFKCIEPGKWGLWNV